MGRLEDAGLIRRAPHPNHGRIQQLHLTDEGQARLNLAHDVVGQVEKEMTAELSRDEVERAKDLLAKCAAALEAE